jgi:hypothetical protein
VQRAADATDSRRDLIDIKPRLRPGSSPYTTNRAEIDTQRDASGRGLVVSAFAFSAVERARIASAGALLDADPIAENTE